MKRGALIRYSKEHLLRAIDTLNPLPTVPTPNTSHGVACKQSSLSL